MLFRVTNQNSVSQFLDQLNSNRGSLDTVRDQIGTGVRVLNPSDDPARTGFISSMQRTVSNLTRHEQRIASATGFIESQDTILQAAQSTILRAKEIGTQAANETMDAKTRATLSEEVFQLRDTMQALANSNYRGVYLWGGLDDDDPPFDLATAPGYVNGTGPAANRYIFDNEPGTQGTRTVQIDETESVRINTPGDVVFSHAIAALERLGRCLDGYRSDPPDYYDDGNGSFTPPANNDFTDLPTGAGLAYDFSTEYHLQTADIYRCIDYLDFAGSTCIGSELTNVGARLQQLENSKVIVESVKQSTEESRSDVQDADIFEASSRFQSLITNLQALLESGTRIQNLSILDYI